MQLHIKYQNSEAGRERLAHQRHQQQLPKITNSQHRKIQKLNFAAYRLVNRLLQSNGVRTDHLCQELAIRNVSDVVLKSASRLERLGISIHCEMCGSDNRYGENGRIGTWWISIDDHALWFSNTAANDGEALCKLS